MMWMAERYWRKDELCVQEEEIAKMVGQYLYSR